MIFKAFNGNLPAVIHFPGKSSEIYADLIQSLKELTVTVGSKITVVTCVTPDLVSESPLIYQMNKSGVNIVNACPEDFNARWSNLCKPAFIRDALCDIHTFYSIVLDGMDTVFVRDVDDYNPKKVLIGYGCDVIFNATQNRFPNLEVDDVPDRDKMGPFRYLNAGACLGKTENLIDFYSLVADLIDEEKELTNIESEQYFVRKVFNNCQDWVSYDHQCRFFQAINKNVQIDPIEEDKKDKG